MTIPNKYFYKSQCDWIKHDSPLKIAVKSCQTGFSHSPGVVIEFAQEVCIADHLRLERRPLPFRRAARALRSSLGGGSCPLTNALIFQLFYTNFPPLVSILWTDLVNGAEQPGWCETLYLAKAAELVLYGRALGLSHSEAEDVLQETFMALMQRSEPPELPEHYCVRSYRNRALNYRRGLWRRLTRELESRRWFDRSSSESPEERAAMHCLAGLPQAQREVIVLKIWHEYTFEEIGQLLEISPNTAAGRYRYGLQKLKACLKGTAYERDDRIGDTTPLARSGVAFVGAAPPLGET